MELFHAPRRFRHPSGWPSPPWAEDEKNRLFKIIATAMVGLPGKIIERQLAHLDKVHADGGSGARKAVAASPVAAE